MTQLIVDPVQLQCPVPFQGRTEITMGHGGGGRLTQDLIDRIFRPAFDPAGAGVGHDGATMDLSGGRIVMTTDAHVVSPLFFPGGDIGTLAINGTVNDLLMCGAIPRWLSASFILEEGFAVSKLERVVASMAEAAAQSGVTIVTGDTKVVEKGKGDGVYIGMAGVGVLTHVLAVEPRSIRAGDVIILSGDVGRHGMAVMASREGVAFESPILSDCASLLRPVMSLFDAGIEVHCLRDLTRGGVATALVELAEASRHSFALRESEIPVVEAVRGACELFGLDPLYVANEGRFVCFVPAEFANKALSLIQENSPGSHPAIIGSVGGSGPGKVYLRSVIGTDRILDRLTGEQLPRIC